MKPRWLVVGAVLGLVVASVAGVSAGLVAAVAVERMRAVLGEVEWDEED